MLRVPAYTYERRPYSATNPPTSFTLNSLLALTSFAQHKTQDYWCLTLDRMACVGYFVRLYVLRREGRRTYWATGGPTGGHSRYGNSSEHKSRELGEF